MSDTDTRRKSAQRRKAILWTALQKLAGSEADRDLLEDGGQHRVSVTIDANVDGHALEEIRFGQLTVGHQRPTVSSSAPNAAHMLAVVAAKLSPATREKLFDELPAEFLKAGDLPPVDAALVKSCKKLLEQLRSKTTGTARGAVVFGEQTPAEFREAGKAADSSGD